MKTAAGPQVEVHGQVSKPRAMEALRAQMASSNLLTGRILIGWPLKTDLVLVSNRGQVTAVNLDENPEPRDYEKRQDDAFNQVDGLLKRNSRFTQGRKPRVRVQTVTMALGVFRPQRGRPGTPPGQHRNHPADAGEVPGRCTGERVLPGGCRGTPEDGPSTLVKVGLFK